MFTEESPQMTDFVNFGDFADLFNATMSYRRDSTIYRPYGLLKRLGSHKPYPAVPQNLFHPDMKIPSDAEAPTWIRESLLKKVPW